MHSLETLPFSAIKHMHCKSVLLLRINLAEVYCYYALDQQKRNFSLIFKILRKEAEYTVCTRSKDVPMLS